ncbi:hypothetical protein ABIC09_006063 [Bradyrhizobium sp. S3.12.5]
MLVQRSGNHWRAAGCSVFVDHAIGLIALAIIVVASLPWSYELITDTKGRYGLLLIDFAALAGGLGFLIFGRLPWPWLSTRWQTKGYFRLLGDCEPVAFRQATRTEDRCPVAADSLADRDHGLMCGPLDRRARFICAGFCTYSARGAHYHDSDIDRRLGRAGSNDGLAFGYAGS